MEDPVEEVDLADLVATEGIVGEEDQVDIMVVMEGIIAAMVDIVGITVGTVDIHGGGHFHGGSRVFLGGYFGFPYYYPYGYYPYPYYYPYSDPYPYYPNYPNAVAEPPAYAEPEQDSYWYYCQAPQGYYPYISSCPGGWTRVVPTPPQSGKEGR